VYVGLGITLATVLGCAIFLILSGRKQAVRDQLEA